jgi:hypothetical protein
LREVADFPERGVADFPEPSRNKVGNDKRISRVLRGLVRDGRLTPVSAKKYIVTPPKLIERADWTG